MNGGTAERERSFSTTLSTIHWAALTRVSRASATAAEADFGFLVAELVEFGVKGRGGVRCELGLEIPVFHGDEGKAFAFAFHDDAQGHGLDTTGGDAAFDFFPEQRGNLVADQTVEDAPCLLGVEQVAVQLAGVGQGVAHRARGDFVELDAADLLVLVLDEFGHMPGDGLPFAVRVGREVDLFGLGGGGFQLGHHFLLAVDDFVHGFEVVVLVNAEIAGGQVAHVADACFHIVLVAEKLLDGLHLGGRLNDDKVFAHDFPKLNSVWVNGNPGRGQGRVWRFRISSGAGRGWAKVTSTFVPDMQEK